MNDQHKDALQIILNNDVVMAALRQVFTEVTREALPDIANEGDSVIGQKYRAYDTATQIIQNGFQRMEQYRKPTSNSQSGSRHI